MTTSWRTDKRTAAQRGYGYKWQKARADYLAKHPLCTFCEAQGRVAVATVVDHKVKHEGDLKVFWDRKNWQGLCAPCHDSTKQAMEKSGKARVGIALDGWPVEK